MPVPRRIARLSQLILEIAAETVQRRLRDPRLGFVTLTRVRLAPDLTEATVYWSALGTDAQRRTSARALHDATPVVQGVVAKAIGTRTTPKLTFRYDPTIAEAARLEGIFETLRRERGEEPAADAAATPAADDADGEDGDDVPGGDGDATEASGDDVPAVDGEPGDDVPGDDSPPVGGDDDAR